MTADLELYPLKPSAPKVVLHQTRQPRFFGESRLLTPHLLADTCYTARLWGPAAFQITLIILCAGSGIHDPYYRYFQEVRSCLISSIHRAETSVAP